MRCRRAGAALGLAAGLLAASASAQSGKDDRELRHFVLTMDKVQRLSGAARGLHELEKRHPEMGSESPASGSIAEMVQNIRKYPDAVAVLTKHGFTPRDYAVGFLTVIQSTMAVGLKRAGTYESYPAELLELVSQANLAFVEQHYAEIQKLMPDWSSEPEEAAMRHALTLAALSCGIAAAAAAKPRDKVPVTALVSRSLPEVTGPLPGRPTAGR